MPGSNRTSSPPARTPSTSGPELGEMRRGRERRVGAVAQQVEGGAQLAQGVVARMLDGREGRARLVGMLVEEVQRDARLHVDEGDVVREHVVQLLRELQPLLARLALARFLGEALLLGALLASHPHHL